MAINVKNLEPISFGIPTHAPMLWRMTRSDSATKKSARLKERLVLFRRADRLLDELEPVSTAQFPD